METLATFLIGWLIVGTLLDVAAELGNSDRQQPIILQLAFIAVAPAIAVLILVWVALIKCRQPGTSFGRALDHIRERTRE